MNHDYLTDYSESVQTCIDALDSARPSDGISECSNDCRHAVKQIKASPATTDQHVKL